MTPRAWSIFGDSRTGLHLSLRTVDTAYCGSDTYHLTGPNALERAERIGAEWVVNGKRPTAEDLRA